MSIHYSSFKFTDLPPIANFISNCLLILLLITFLYALCIRFFPDQSLYDLLMIPSGYPEKVTYFIQTNEKSKEILPSPLVLKSSKVYLTVVIPIDTNENNLQIILDSIIGYLQERQSQNPQFTWEIIISDINSHDETQDATNSYINYKFNEIHFIYSHQVHSIGAAIEAGVIFSTGKYILVVDPIDSIQIQNLSEMERKMRQLQEINPESIVIGSRAHLCTNNQNIFTNFGEFNSSLFKFLLSFAGVKNIQDSQCGFKFYSREAARTLFTNQHISNFSDPEIILIAQKTQMQISEIPVECNNNYYGNEKNIGLFNSMKIFFDLMKIAVLYRIGFWTITKKDEIEQDFEL